jgi:hypothetical protein
MFTKKGKIILLSYAIFLIVFWGINTIAFMKKVDKVNFYKEIISIFVQKSEFEVRADYFYKNLSGEKLHLYACAPFPVRDGISFPDEKQISLMEDGKIPIYWEKSWNKIDFYLFFEPHEDKKITLTYRQKANNDKGIYILTTTNAWRRPISEGYYFLKMSKDCKFVSSNYPLEKLPQDGDSSKDISALMKILSETAGKGENSLTDRFYFVKYGFMPGKDWNFSWKSGQQ